MQILKEGHKELNHQQMSADGFKIAFWQKHFLVSLLSACLAAFECVRTAEEFELHLPGAVTVI